MRLSKRSVAPSALDLLSHEQQQRLTEILDRYLRGLENGAHLRFEAEASSKSIVDVQMPRILEWLSRRLHCRADKTEKLIHRRWCIVYINYAAVQRSGKCKLHGVRDISVVDHARPRGGLKLHLTLGRNFRHRLDMPIFVAVHESKTQD